MADKIAYYSMKRAKGSISTNKIIILGFLLIFVILTFLILEARHNKNGNEKHVLPMVKISPRVTTGVETCRTSRDCGKDEYCAVEGPIIFNPLTHKPDITGTCHTYGTAAPY